MLEYVKKYIPKTLPYYLELYADESSLYYTINRKVKKAVLNTINKDYYYLLREIKKNPKELKTQIRRTKRDLSVFQSQDLLASGKGSERERASWYSFFNSSHGVRDIDLLSKVLKKCRIAYETPSSIKLKKISFIYISTTYNDLVLIRDKVLSWKQEGHSIVIYSKLDNDIRKLYKDVLHIQESPRDMIITNIK